LPGHLHYRDIRPKEPSLIDRGLGRLGARGNDFNAVLLRRDFITLSTRLIPLYATNLGQDYAMLDASASSFAVTL
jgi:hypothetical protein